MPPEAFCEGADALLEARKQFLKHPSYVNCFLVDTINRVIYINLGERLAKAGDVPVCYDRITEHLAESRYDWSLLFELANGEYGANQISRTEIEKLSPQGKAEAIGKMIGQEFFFFLPQDAHNLYNLRILEKRSSSAWLARLISSDHAIGALSALLSYRRKTTHFTPMDTVEQIRAVLGDDTPLVSTWLFDDSPRAADVIDNFLREIQSEKWRMMLGFSDPPFFTKEFIERAEEEEAEREAQREAQMGNPAK